jgi:MinD superfamily P-loop ATPase
MKQLVIISGKGGTGKTTVSGSFASLASNIIVADCDVEAPNLHLILVGKDIEEEDFSGGRLAEIDPIKCIGCGRCSSVCKFGAIVDFIVSELKCEGCGTCQVVCPSDAISFTDKITGKSYVTDCSGLIFCHARLEPGGEGSGKLVTSVRKKSLEYNKKGETIIIDGSPGIGCVVIASITGCDAALVVTEPTRSGLDDLKRVLAVCEYFGVNAYICINKFDINRKIAGELEEYCEEKGYRVIGKIPYDEKVLDALKCLKPVVEMKDSPAAREISNMYGEIIKLMEVD